MYTVLGVVGSLCTTENSRTDLTCVRNVQKVKSCVCVDEILNTKVVTEHNSGRLTYLLLWLWHL